MSKTTFMQNSERYNIALDINIDGANWTGGISYINNLINALRKIRDSKHVISLLVNAQNNSLLSSIECQPDSILLPNIPSQSSNLVTRHWTRLQHKFGIQNPHSHPLGKYLQSQGIDVLFSKSHFGENFPLPLISWIPDFQHIHYPEMFSEKELEDRNRLFHQIIKYADRFLLSSQDALRDLSKFAPDALQKARVLSLPAQIPESVYSTVSSEVCSLYFLPQRFIFLPNQFWKHKNHITAINALDILRKKNKRIKIVCTGNTNDYRNPTHFSDLLCYISQLNLREDFIILGMVPKSNYYQIMRQSLAVLQPSLFEGWSTTIEEAKALGKPLIVSDIPVHNEQCKSFPATYFSSKDPESLAELLFQIWENKEQEVDLNKERNANNESLIRTEIVGKQFVDIIREIVF